MISVQLTLEQAHWLDKHLKALCKMQSMLPQRGDGNASDVLAEVERAIEQQAVKVDPQPPAENYGVETMFCHDKWLCVYRPFKEGTARWGTTESPFGQDEVTVECVDGVWYWVRKNANAVAERLTAMLRENSGDIESLKRAVGF